MKKLHLAISTNNLAETVTDYNQRLGCEPCLVIEGQYALWRTEHINLSVRQDSQSKAGTLRHLGWELPNCEAFSESSDVNGIVWEQFTALQQAEEIKALWPEVDYKPS